MVNNSNPLLFFLTNQTAALMRFRRQKKGNTGYRNSNKWVGLGAERFGFNGMERDDEITSSGGSFDFKFRIYEARLGKFFSTDPLFGVYPWNSTYAFAENRTIDGRDLEGKEWENFRSKFKNPGALAIKVPNERTAQSQNYSVEVQNAQKSFQDLKADFKSAPQDFLSNSKATFNGPVDREGVPTQFAKDSYIKIDISGPFNNGYVKVAVLEERDDLITATFVTMEGHMEKGIITFSMSDKGDGKLEFHISSISEVDQGSARTFAENYSRDQQKESWDEVLTNFVQTSGGEEASRSTEVESNKIELGGGNSGGGGAGSSW